MSLAQVAPEHRGVVAVRNEADLERLRLVRRRQSERPRGPPDLRLRQVADREEQSVQDGPRKTPQEVRLVLTVVRRPAQQSALGPARQASVVTRRDVATAQRVGPPDQVPELREAVAPHARNRCAPGSVLAHEVANHVLRELPLQIEHAVWRAETCRHRSSICNALEAAARAGRSGTSTASPVATTTSARLPGSSISRRSASALTTRRPGDGRPPGRRPRPPHRPRRPPSPGRS